MTPDPRVVFRTNMLDPTPLPIAAKRLARIVHRTDADTAMAMARVDQSKRYVVGPEAAIYVDRANLERLATLDRSAWRPMPLEFRLMRFKALKPRK